jgi:peptide/nickel transport system substrate-binding protein
MVVEQSADGQPLPYLQEVRIIGVAEMSSQIAGLTSGSLDLLNELTAEVLGPLTSNPAFQVIEIPSPAFHEVNMRVELQPYNDVRVR